MSQNCGNSKAFLNVDQDSENNQDQAS